MSSIFSNRTHAVCKCALQYMRMTTKLVVMLNLLVKEKYYPQRQLNLVNTSLEKGKGPVLRKLRFIMLIEADMQVGLRIALGSEEEELIKKDKRFSSANNGSRQNYLVESVVLEKR